MNIAYRARDRIQRLFLVEGCLLKVVASILLKNQAPVPPQDIRLVERAHDFLHEIDITEAFRQLRLPGKIVTQTGYLLLLLLLIFGRGIRGPRYQMHYLVIDDLVSR